MNISSLAPSTPPVMLIPSKWASCVVPEGVDKQTTYFVRLSTTRWLKQVVLQLIIYKHAPAVWCSAGGRC